MAKKKVTKKKPAIKKIVVKKEIEKVYKHKEKFINMVSNLSGLPTHAISEESHFHDHLGFDSLDDIELLMMCEQQFHIAISDLDAERVSTVKEALELIELLIKK